LSCEAALRAGLGGRRPFRQRRVRLARSLTRAPRACRRARGRRSRDALARTRVDSVAFHWAAAGDLLRRDWFGFYYWVDRAGDSFRWRGENVASAEVEGVLARAAGISDAAVYGVRVPGCEGRAGMAAVTLALAAKPPAHAAAAALDGATLFAHCAAELAPFARPAFVRVLGAGGLAFTATHKLQKGALRAAGWDAARCGGDALYVRDDRRSAYVPLDAEAVRALEGGALRL
jgi:acyl-CoA synthetase (AMP-forming)/AMP-acid ligase II